MSWCLNEMTKDAKFLLSNNNFSVSRSGGCQFTPAAQSGGCWSPSVEPWWRLAPPAVCPVRPSSWRSVPRRSWYHPRPAAPPAAAESPAAVWQGYSHRPKQIQNLHSVRSYCWYLRRGIKTSISTLCKSKKEQPSKMHLITTSASNF